MLPKKSAYIVSDLRLALATLYSLPTISQQQTKTCSPTQAHEFLLNFQHRNLRRKRNQTLKKNEQSQQQKQQHQSNTNVIDCMYNLEGSTWLGCIDILSSFLEIKQSNAQAQAEVYYEEALFAAQTLVHRLRRIKLCEAIDIEFELEKGDGNSNRLLIELSATKTTLTPQEVNDIYRYWIMQCYHHEESCTVLSQLLCNYKPMLEVGAATLDINNNQQLLNNGIDLEERVKGEISMMVLASILNTMTKKCYECNHHADANANSQIQPLLKTLATALALITARMRYTSSSLPQPAPQTQSCVTMILSSINMVQQQESKKTHNTAMIFHYHLYCICLAALPEAILNSSKGNSFSLDPRCYTALYNEIKTQGVMQLLHSLQDIQIPTNNYSALSIHLLQMFESWSKYIPLPIEFINQTIPLVLQVFHKYKDNCYNQSLQQQQKLSIMLEYKAAMMYYISIMEGGNWTIDQIILSSCNKENGSQTNKKRQSSKSKKREQYLQDKKKIDDYDLLLNMAQNEVQLRGDVACLVAQSTWDIVRELLHVDLSIASATAVAGKHFNDNILLGDGPTGAMTACANSCLPHILRTFLLSFKNNDNAHQQQHTALTNSLKLFTCVSQEIQNICASPLRIIRSFASESLYTLYDVLVIDSKNVTNDNEAVSTLLSLLVTHSTTNNTSLEFLEVIMQHFINSSMNLACQCRYPSGYFNDLGMCFDEDLEEERKSIRDLLRSVSNIPSSAPSLVPFASSILLRLIQACAQPIQVAATSNNLYPETALHAFSALAKPINAAASLYYSNFASATGQDHNQKHLHTILKLSIEITTIAGKRLVSAFPHTSVNDMLPLSRLYNLLIASLSPMLSAMAKIQPFESELVALMRVGIEVAANSILILPELAFPSSLRGTRSDIRGAMRTPGGEDHVGVLALMRLANDSSALSHVFLKTNESVVLDICGVYQELKKMEDQRGPGVYHGIGVLPKSRRILLGTICHLELISGGTSRASSVLTSSFENAICSIANASSQLEHPSAEILFSICENTFDIAAYDPKIINSLFVASDDADIRRTCLRVLHEAGNFGFKAFDGNVNITCDNIMQWNRLRAALYTLMKITGRPDLPTPLVDTMISWIKTECLAVSVQCAAGPSSTSKIFCEDVISDENIPPGIFFRVIVETLERAFSSHTPVSMLMNTLYVLCELRDVALSTITLDCPMPVQHGSFYDPRPVIAELWFMCMIKLSIGVQGELRASKEIEVNVVTDVKQLLVKTFVASVTLLLYSSLERTQEKRAKNPGMNLDGPQGLLMLDFFEAYFNLGFFMLQAAANELAEVIPVDCQEPGSAGMAIIGAALLRAWQGGLPPWAVENVAFVCPALFQALNKNVDTFGHLFEISMTVRLLQNKRFGCVESGNLLSGEFMAKMSDKAKHDFIKQAKEFARSDTAISWKRLKVLIKLCCGGKKKETDFNQRPALTNWDKLDRI